MQNVNIDTVNGAIKNKKITMLILDGWGLSASWSGNAISFSNPQNFNYYWRTYPHTILQAFKGIADEKGNVGNSEIGHASIGTGRIIRQDLTEINEAIDRGYFYENPVLKNAIAHTKKFKSNLHFVGLLSDGAVHSHIKHLFALLNLAKINNIKNVYIHIITDGIDTDDRSAVKYISILQNYINKVDIGKISTIIGRFYAMDKSGNNERIEKAFLLQSKGKGRIFDDPIKAVKNFYTKGYFDKNIPPVVINNDQKNQFIKNFDSLIFYNFRADRARSLAMAYTSGDFFKGILGRKYKLQKDLFVATLTNYQIPNSNIEIVFSNAVINDNLSAILSRAGLKQLKIAESEKQAHVTYFFNGGVFEPYRGEDRLIVKSPEVDDYTKTPAMSSEKIAQNIIKAIKSNKYNFIVANIANVDMLAHTGDIIATSNAVKITDKLIKQIVDANKENITIITADHGNAEELISYKGTSIKETKHTVNPVPFIVIDKYKEKNLAQRAIESSHILINDVVKTNNNLADIAPTILDLCNIAKPANMTGHSLLKEIGYK